MERGGTGQIAIKKDAARSASPVGCSREKARTINIRIRQSALSKRTCE
jgi:hypothetical protein